MHISLLFAYRIMDILDPGSGYACKTFLAPPASRHLRPWTARVPGYLKDDSNLLL
jgi:hypothetical protein